MSISCHVAGLVAAACIFATTCSAQEESTEVELKATRDTLGRSYTDWSSAEALLSHRFKDGSSVYGSVRETRRFSLDDDELRAGGYLPLSEDWSALVEGSESASHKVLARWSVLAQLQRRLGDGWDVQAGLRHTEYDVAITNLTILTVERYWRDYRAAFTACAGNLEGTGTFPSGRVQFDYYYGDNNRIGFSFGAGREAENVGSAGVLVSKVRDAALIGTHWLNRAWAITYATTLHRQDEIYMRHGIELGLRYRF